MAGARISKQIFKLTVDGFDNFEFINFCNTSSIDCSLMSFVHDSVRFEKWGTVFSMQRILISY